MTFLSACRADQAWALKEAVLLSESLLFRCLLRRWGCGHNNSGDRFGGIRSCSLLKMGRRDGLDTHLFAKRMSGQQMQIGLSVENKQQKKRETWYGQQAHRGPYLCGLTLLLELLKLLSREETHRLIASDELSTRWHGGEDDVAAQPTEAVDGKQDRELPPTQNQAMY